MSDQSIQAPLLALGLEQEAYDRIVGTIAYFEKNEPIGLIGIGAVSTKSHENVADVKKVLFYFLQTGRLQPTFKAYCKSCGYLGETAINVQQISDLCPCCYNKIMRIIDFWAVGYRPEVEEKECVNA